MTHMATLTERINEAIKHSSADVADIARACGITPQAVYMWMSGDTKQIMGDYLVELAEITGYEARWIAKELGPKRRLRPQTSQQEHVLRAMQTMAPYQAEMLVKISDTVAESKDIPNGNPSSRAAEASEEIGLRVFSLLTALLFATAQPCIDASPPPVFTARGRTGSKRVGGRASSGKGGHYVGGGATGKTKPATPAKSTDRSHKKK